MMTRDQLIEAGLVDASDVYDIPHETSSHPSVRLDGWWLILATNYLVGPYDTRDEAHEAMIEDNPFVDIDPTTTEIVYLTTVR